MAYKIGEIADLKGSEQAFQGDVFVGTATLPKDAVKMEPKNGLHVFAEGETTGHVHAVRAEEADVYCANDNTRMGGKRYFVVIKRESALMFHGIPGKDGLPEVDLGDHAWLKLFKPKKKNEVKEPIRQRVLDLSDPRNFRQVAD